MHRFHDVCLQATYLDLLIQGAFHLARTDILHIAKYVLHNMVDLKTSKGLFSKGVFKTKPQMLKEGPEKYRKISENAEEGPEED